MAATTTDLATALNAAIQGGNVAHLAGQTYTISSPIVIHVTSTTQGALGIDGGGATFVSQVTDGSPLIKIVVGPGVDFRYLTLSNFTIEGNGREGSGIQIVADGNDRWAYSWNIDNVTVENTGGYGLDVQGSVFEGLVSDSWMNGNALGGAHFAHSPGGGQASALRWFGGGFKDNGGAGLTLDDGARDMSVDDAVFLNNQGAGVSAGSGITSVTDSHFQDNHGPGIWFQNYGNFSSNTFASSGSQTVGITGYLAGGATLVDNTSTYTGPGADTIALANLQGNGNAFLTGDDGPIITGSGIARYGEADGTSAHVLVIPGGVALPALAAVTAATTAPLPSSTGTGVLETALRAAMGSGQVTQLTDATYTVTTPIVINLTSSTGGPIGFDLGGAKIRSLITDGSPVIQIIVGPGVDLGSLTLSNFSIQGNGLEGDGIKIVANGADRLIHDMTITNVHVEHVGGIGLDILGNVSQGSVVNSWMHGNDQAGARFANSTGGGVVGTVEWVGGGFRKNGGAGLILDNGAHDVTIQGAYFVENSGPGIHATSGLTLVEDSGFENNQGAGAIVLGSANFSNSSFSTYGPQAVGVAGYLAGDQITLTGLGIEYYGPGTNPTTLANVQGSGSLAVTGTSGVVVGPGITVTGGQPYSPPPPPPDTTQPLLLSITASGLGIGAGAGDLGVGKTVTLTVTFDEAVIVSGGTPTLQLNDGGVASFIGGSGHQSVLTFAHTVQPGRNAADLTVLSISLNGAAIEDAAGNAANVSAATNYNPSGILKIDTTAHVSVTALSAALPEGTLAAAVFSFTVTLSAPSASSQTVSWAVAGSGANPAGPADFTGGVLPSGVLTFAVGETSKSILVGVLGDTALEPSEGFRLALSNPSSGLTIDTPSATATILDDDASVSIAAQSAVKAEGNGGTTLFTFTATLAGDSSAARSVSWSVTGSGASPAGASDFAAGVLPGGTLTFAPGETSKTITVSVAGDTAVETDEGFTVTLSAPSSGLTIAAASATGTIVNDDATVSVSALSATAAEGNSGSTAFSFLLTRTGDASALHTVSYLVAGSGANPASASDFAGGLLPGGTVTFAAGETTRTITVNIAGDTAVEASEGFTLTLSTPSPGLAIGTAAAIGAILNDDVPPNDAIVSVAALSALKAEGNGGSTAFTFVMTRTGDATVSRTVSYVVAGSGTNAADASDFAGGVLPGGTATFAAGETSKTITVSVAGDTAVEGNEGFILSLSNPSSGLTIGTPSATATIVNDDATVSVAALSAVRAEGNGGPTAFTFVVTRTGDTTVAHTVSYAVAGSGANPASASDFSGGVLPGGTMTFAPGEASKTVTVTIAGDTVVEANEGFTLSLSNPSSGLAIGTASATGTIQNDDATVSLAALATVRAEGNGGPTAFTFVVTRTGDTTVAHTVSYAVAGSGANPASASDFIGGALPGGTVTFAPGEASKTITVTVAGDTAVEAHEGFVLSLSNPSSGLAIGTTAATGTIQNDDATVSLAALAAAKAEGNGGSTAFTFVVTRAGDATAAHTVSYSVAGSGANPASASDFSGGMLPAGSLTFAPGETSKTITVTVAGDTAVEAHEGFVLTLSNPSSGLTIDTASATGTIQNDDTALPVATHDDAYVVLQGQSLAAMAGVLLNDLNASNATLLGDPAHGTLYFSAGGTFTYIPAPGYFGIDSFSYRAGNTDAQALLYVVPVSTAGATTTLTLTALSVEQLIASTYIAFFGRAADADGFDFWVDQFISSMSTQTTAGLFANIASSFGLSDEAKQLYPFLAHPSGASDNEIESFLDSVYDNLFNRSVDSAGLAYWTSQVRQKLATGQFVGSVLVDVMSGAQNSGAAQDVTTLMAKAAVGLHYVHEQERHGTIWTGAGDVAAATALVGAVSAEPHSLLVGLRNADTLIAAHP